MYWSFICFRNQWLFVGSMLFFLFLLVEFLLVILQQDILCFRNKYVIYNILVKVLVMIATKWKRLLLLQQSQWQKVICCDYCCCWCCSCFSNCPFKKCVSTQFLKGVLVLEGIDCKIWSDRRWFKSCLFRPGKWPVYNFLRFELYMNCD